MLKGICGLLAGMMVVLVLVGGAPAGEKLHNGIVLPDQWPPVVKELTREPMAVPYLENPPKEIALRGGRQLFIDDFLIDKTTLKRTYHQATLHAVNPVIKPDKPWENDDPKRRPTAMVFSDGVWYDPADGLFKMWYMGGYTKSVCYATSKDGIQWEKPVLDVVDGTNIVSNESRDTCAVWLDLQASDPAQRYKMLTTQNVHGPEAPEGRQVRLLLYYSADGIHWGEPVAKDWSRGDRSGFYYDPFRKVWVCSVREMDETVGRCRYYAEGKTLEQAFKNIDKNSVPWTCADHLDPRNPNPQLKDVEPQLYNLDATPYESLTLGFFSIWQGDPYYHTMPRKAFSKRNEILLGFSRDGFHWHRPDRKAFIGVDETDGAWNWGNVQSAGGGCLVVGDKLYFYVSGRGQDRHKGAAVTGLAELRRDGFASMDAGEEMGTLTTRPLFFSGKHLFVNADARGGELRVAVLDKDGEVFRALDYKRCKPITTDGTCQEVRWVEPIDLSALAYKTVRFRFYLTKGKLYSFWVSPDRSGASQGYVAAGGPGFTNDKDTVGRAGYEVTAKVSPSCVIQQKMPAGTWECVTQYGPFEPRDCAECFVFDGKMWLSNGWYSGTVYLRDLWCSADGKNWTLVTEKTPYDVFSRTVVFKDKVWAFGSSVWNSDDGVHWNKVSDKPSGGSTRLGTIVFKDRIWQVGGKRVQWTEDGVNWTCVTDNAPYGSHGSCTVNSYAGKLWLMAGNKRVVNDPPEKHYRKYTSLNDVWCSEDGVNWECVLEHAPWAPRMWPVSAVYDGKLWLIGGFDNANAKNLGDVWFTKDGRNWTQYHSPQQFAPRHAAARYVFKDSLWVVCGNTWPIVNDVWRLTLPGAHKDK